METIILHPNTQEELSLYEQMARILKTPFEKMVVESPYNSELVKKVMERRACSKIR